MFNLLRIRDGQGLRRVKLFSVAANVIVLTVEAPALENVRALGADRRISGPSRNHFLNRADSRAVNPKISDAVTFAVRIRPRARTNTLTGRLGDTYKLSLTAPPVEGKANEACIEFLAKLLKVPRSSVSIAAGQTSRNKVIRVVGLSAKEVEARLSLGSPS